MKYFNKRWLKKNWSNLATVILLILLLIPQTRSPIMVFVQRTFAFSPSETNSGKQLGDYSWDLNTLEGRFYPFAKAKGEVAVINFWATWCAPCVAEMPYFQELYDEYGDDVKFYFVTKEEPEVVHSFMQKHELNLPIYRPRSTAPELLRSKALPTTFVLGKNGDVHIEKKGSAKWNSESVKNLLEELLAE